MLTKSRQAGSYRSQAGALYEDLVDLRLNGHPTLPGDDFTRARVASLEGLLQVGPRQPDGSLDKARSSPEALDLDKEVVDLVPKVLPRYQPARFNMQEWVHQAVRVLDVLSSGRSWNTLDHADREFAEQELEPFLYRLVSLGPEEPDVG